MNEQKRYAAYEIRNQADFVLADIQLSDYGRRTTSDMLRQAADAEEELDALRKATKVEVHLDGAEVNAALARKVDEMRECLKEAVGFFDRLSEGIEVDKGFLTMCNKWRKALEGANHES